MHLRKDMGTPLDGCSHGLPDSGRSGEDAHHAAGLLRGRGKGGGGGGGGIS